MMKDPMLWDINDELREQAALARAKARQTPEQRAIDSLRMQCSDMSKKVRVLREEVARLQELVMSPSRGPSVEYK